LFVDLSVSGQLQQWLPQVQPVAAATKGRIQWVYIDAGKYGRHAERLALQPSIWPALALDVPSTGKHYAFDQSAQISTEGVQAWIDCYIAGTLLPTVKSEEIPTDASGPVRVLVAKNAESVVLNPELDVFVDYFAPWCGHCKKLTPIWDQLAAMLADNPGIVIAKCDATANDVDPKFGEIRGFPTLKFFPAGSDKVPVEYNGDRSLDSLVDFVKAHATKTLTVNEAVSQQALKDEL